MKPGYVCVAGIEPDSGEHIRPVLNRRQLSRALLRKEGGVFEIGALVNLGPTKCVGQAPEMEDHQFSVENLRYERRLNGDKFWEYLIQASEGDLKSIFGDDIAQRDNSCTVDVGCGSASLGNLNSPEIADCGINRWGKIRLSLSGGKFHPELSVTDIRLYNSDQKTAREEIVEAVASQLSETGVVLAVGLSRAWKKEGDTAQRHWLQVNNIHLEEDPLGEIYEF
jgi:hypothetical protein